VRVVDTTQAGVCDQLTAILPPGDSGTGAVDEDVRYRVDGAARGHYQIRRDDGSALETGTLQEAVRWLAGDVDRTVSERSTRGFFVHAGAVGWRGRAILVPGRSMSGKSTLVEALVRHGATYYSDEYAVFDAEGRVWPYARRAVLRGPTGLRPGNARTEPGRAGGTPPLPPALIVSTPFRAGVRWRPEVLRGAAALLPLIDNTVLARVQPARTLQLAAGLASGVVALSGERPEADDVAPRILEFLDDLVEGRRSTAGQPAGRRRVLAAAFADRRGASIPDGGAPEPGILQPARYVQIDGLLSPAEERRVLDEILAREADFGASEVLHPDGVSSVDPAFRRSRTLFDVESIWHLLEGRLRRLLPHVRRELGLPWFPVARIERQAAVHREGDFFAPHTDEGTPKVAGRRLTCVCYFHDDPRRFGGGQLRLHDTLVRNGVSEVTGTFADLEPRNNTAVFFPSDLLHEVRAVREAGDGFRDGRFAINVWFWSGEYPSWAPRAAELGPRPVTLANPLAPQRRPEGDPVDTGAAKDSPARFAFKPHSTLMDYLNPTLFENPRVLEDIGRRLRTGGLVIIRDAFSLDFAEAVWQDLARDDINWMRHEDSADYGFTYVHHNVYDWKDYSVAMREAYSLFDHPETKRWMTRLSGRDCSGEGNASGSASNYFPGDYSMPHTDHYGQRAMAFVWHLSKNWDPRWGGALYWTGEHHEHAYQHATFNTLTLFSVTAHTTHFVTAVSRHAKEKRLAFSGWWDASYCPKAEDPLIERYATAEDRLTLTKNQSEAILKMDFSGVSDPKRRAKLEEIQSLLYREQYPERKSVHVVDLRRK
jgi:Rps23 Pro-64 3,4-dihydroxylase Tpa1-like proline 4-hydroxylase